MAKMPSWTITITQKTKHGYTITHQSRVPYHKLTDAVAQNLLPSLYLAARNGSPSDIIESNLVRHKPRSFLAECASARSFVDIEKRVQGYVCGCTECIVSASHEIPSLEALSLYRQEQQRHAAS